MKSRGDSCHYPVSDLPAVTSSVRKQKGKQLFTTRIRLKLIDWLLRCKGLHTNAE